MCGQTWSLPKSPTLLAGTPCTTITCIPCVLKQGVLPLTAGCTASYIMGYSLCMPPCPPSQTAPCPAVHFSPLHVLTCCAWCAQPPGTQALSLHNRVRPTSISQCDWETANQLRQQAYAQEVRHHHGRAPLHSGWQGGGPAFV